MRLEVVLPIPPSVNHIYQFGRRGVHKAQEALIFEQQVVITLRQAYGVIRVTPPIRIWVDLRVPSWRTTDIDNICKALLDSLAHALEFNDNRVVGLYMDKTVQKGIKPECRVTLKDAEERE